MDTSDSTPNAAASRVRPARAEEMGTIRDFQLAMAMESENLRLDPEVCLRGVSRVFAEPALGEYWIMEIPGPDGRPRTVGCTLIQSEWSDWRARKVLWIHSLYVLPEFRGQGLTRETYEVLRARVKSDPNLAGLRLYVDQKNPNAIAIYEKMGMTREHYHLYEWMKS